MRNRGCVKKAMSFLELFFLSLSDLGVMIRSQCRFIEGAAGPGCYRPGLLGGTFVLDWTAARRGGA